MKTYNMKFILELFICVLFFSSVSSCSQKIIEIRGGSFENQAGPFCTDKDWSNCDSNADSCPCTHSFYSNIYLNNQDAIHGGKYLSLTLRSDGTNGAISQKLNEPLLKGKVYQLNLLISKSDKFFSKDIITHELDSFTNPGVIELWGGRSKCERTELLARTEAIDHKEWKNYRFQFKIESDAISSLLIGAQFVNENADFYNGHILIDYCSNIERISDKDYIESVRINPVHKDYGAFTNKQDLYLLLRDSNALNVCKKKNLVNLLQISDLAELESMNNSALSINIYLFKEGPFGYNREGKIQGMVNSLNHIGLVETANTLKKIYELRQGPKKTDYGAEYMTYYHEADKVFREMIEKEGLERRIVEYIEKARSSILEELKILENSI